MNKKLNFILAFTLSTVLLSVSSYTQAQTPDGETPAQESQCDDLMAEGVTKGLYGLCVAYCEAQDGNDISVMKDEEIAALPPQQRSILKNYNKRRKEGDPEMPCAKRYDELACPAWTLEQLRAVGDHALRDDIELEYTPGVEYQVWGGFTSDQLKFVGSVPNATTFSWYNHSHAYVSIKNDESGAWAAIRLFNEDGTLNWYNHPTLTIQEARACASELESNADYLGLIN